MAADKRLDSGTKIAAQSAAILVPGGMISAL